MFRQVKFDQLKIARASKNQEIFSGFACWLKLHFRILQAN